MVYIFCVIDGTLPILPSETLLVALASVAVGTGTPNLFLLALVGALGAITGDQIAYRLGRRIGTERFGWMRTRRSRKLFAFASHELMKRGALLIFTARYIPVGRVAVNFTAGATNYSLRRFTVLDVIGCLTWAGYSVAIGAVAGKWFHDNQLLGIGISIVLAILMGFVIDRVITLVLKRLGRDTEDATYRRLRQAEAAEAAEAAERQKDPVTIPGDIVDPGTGV